MATLLISPGPGEEFTGSEDLINLTDVRARIDALKPFHVEDERLDPQRPRPAHDHTVRSFTTREEADAWIASDDAGEPREFYQTMEWTEESDELAALKGLEATMAELGSERASAIHEGYSLAFVRDELEDIYGEAYGELDSFIDWDGYRTARLPVRYSFRGQDYYLIP